MIIDRWRPRSSTEVKVHATSVCPAEVDSRRIVRVLRNLLVNAIEHSEGEPIDVFVETDGVAVSVAVRDHGVGFEAVQAKQVFLRFWRADPARTRVVGGTGLGLAISMEDARLHGGWLNAWGRPGQGAQFRLTLPRRWVRCWSSRRCRWCPGTCSAARRTARPGGLHSADRGAAWR